MSGFFCQFLSICTEFYRVFNNYYTISSPIPPPAIGFRWGSWDPREGGGGLGSAPPSLPPLLPPFAFVKEVGTVGEIQYAEQKSRAKERLDRQVLFHFLSLSLSLYLFDFSLWSANQTWFTRISEVSTRHRTPSNQNQIKGRECEKNWEESSFFWSPIKKKGRKKDVPSSGFVGNQYRLTPHSIRFFIGFYRVFTWFFLTPKRAVEVQVDDSISVVLFNK